MYRKIKVLFKNLLTLILRYTPIYPYYFYFGKCWEDNFELIEYIKGDVIEIGCGTSSFKSLLTGKIEKLESGKPPNFNEWIKDFLSSFKIFHFLSKTNKVKTSEVINKWDSTDLYESGNENERNDYDKKNTELEKSLFFNNKFLRETLLGLKIDYKKIDFPVDCRNMSQSADESYDTCICREVLEHVFEYKNAFSEMSRILRPGGSLIISVPFLYQEHGPLVYREGSDELLPKDFQRFCKHKIKREITAEGFECVRAFSNVSFFIALTQLINSFFLRRFYVTKFKIIFLPLLPVGFFFVNVVCWCLDKIFGTDENYLGHYNFVFKKNK